MHSAILALLFLATNVSFPATNVAFPDDYTPSPCAAENVCQSYDRTQLKSAAFTMLGLSPDAKWFENHYDEMLKLYAPICRKHATCLATPGNNFLFCDDIVIREYRAVCDTAYPKSKNAFENEQCREFTEIWALGVDMRANAVSVEGQKCAKEKGLDVMHAKPPIVWVEPSPIPRGYKGDIYVYALDPDTHVPVQANIEIEKQQIYSPANPTGRVATGYPFKWSHKYNRVKTADGHADLAPPMLTLTPQFYPAVTIPLPSPAPKMIVEMKPAKLKRGVNKVTVTARDAESGEPVEARVMAGHDVAGDTNQPIEITVPKSGKVPEIWVTSLFDAYGDVVVKPDSR